MIKPFDAITFGTFSKETGVNVSASKMLYLLYIILFVIVLLTILLPANQMRRHHRMNRSPWAIGFIFMLLGLGFMLIEIPFIQKLTLILGHPVYAVSVVLSTLLISTGIGAALSKKIIFKGQLYDKRLAYFLLLPGLIVIIFFVVTNSLSHHVLRLGGLERFSISIIIIILCGFIMGLPFPSIVLALKHGEDEEAIPWLWAVNGAASVLGSVLAFAAALLVGFTYTVMFGSLCYLIAAFLIVNTQLQHSNTPTFQQRRVRDLK